MGLSLDPWLPSPPAPGPRPLFAAVVTDAAAGPASSVASSILGRIEEARLSLQEFRELEARRAERARRKQEREKRSQPGPVSDP